jgi:RNA polymerase sigma factor (sigma-70 family)
MGDVTQIILEIEQGHENAVARLMAVVYDELRRLASAKLAHEKPGHTLQTTALVHEAYLRLTGGGAAADQESSGEPTDPASSKVASWRSRGHFFAAAAEAMRRILIESARSKKRLKRGGDAVRVPLEHVEPMLLPAELDLLALDEALTKLETVDKVKADVVKLRFFAGLSIEQTAEVLGVSAPTVKRYWLYSRAWLSREISKGDEIA